MLDLLGQHDWRRKQFFKDPRLRAMFTFQVPLCAVWHVAVWSAAVRRAAGSGLSAPQMAVCCRQTRNGSGGGSSQEIARIAAAEERQQQ